MPKKPSAVPLRQPRGAMEYARLYLGGGRYREFCLGLLGSPEADKEYARICAEIAAAGAETVAASRDVTVLELAVAYLEWAASYYDAATLFRHKAALSPVLRLYGHRPVSAFGPLALETCRAALVAETDEAGGPRFCRTFVNTMTGCIRHCWRWGVSKEMVRAEQAEQLDTLKPLREGKTTAPEAPPVRAFDLALVEPVAIHLPPPAAGLVRLLVATGMRPGEACRIRPGDILRPWKTFHGAEVWLYRPGSWKTRWKGTRREIPLPPAAQAVLAPFLEGRPEGLPCFSPEESSRWWFRKHGRRYPADRKARRPGTQYNATTLAQVVRKTCDRHGVTRWSPGQVRHAVATLVETRFSREDARCVLGHAEPGVTAVYAEWTDRAASVLARLNQTGQE